MYTKEERILECLNILTAIGMPSAQLNKRTALSLLALLDLSLDKEWNQSTNPRLTIRGILDFARTKMDTNYAENTRESIRKYSVKQMVQAGILLKNPDDISRQTNNKNNCYQIEFNALQLFKKYGTTEWEEVLEVYLKQQPSLAETFERQRKVNRLAVKVKEDQEIMISPGKHSELIKKIIEEFAEIFVPGGELIYVGETESKWGYFDKMLLSSLGINVEAHGKMPDVIIYQREKNWLFLIETVATGGPVDGIRHIELSTLFTGCSAGLVFVTAFPDRGKLLRKFLASVSWETEVWCASDPTHLIHFNGERFLGPY